MDSRRAVAWWLMLGLGAVSGRMSLAQEPADGLRVARLIRQLGAGSYREREQAGVELLQLGSESRAALETASRAAEPEIRLRALQLLRQAKSAELWQASRITYRGEGVPAAQALAAIAQASGNRLLAGDEYGTFKQGFVRLASQNQEFWPLLDEFCRQSENHYRPHYDPRHPGLVLVSGRLGQHPVAYAGPVRARMLSARREFKEELDYEEGASETTHTFELNLEMIWEDRLRLVAYRAQPELIEALTDTDQRLSAVQPAGAAWNVATPTTRQLTMRMRLQPPSPRATRLDRLALSWGLIVVGDMASLECDTLAEGQTLRQDDVQLTIEKLEHRGGARYELSLLVARDLVIPEPQEILFLENTIELFDAEGRPFRNQGQSNHLADDGVRFRVSFSGEQAESAPKHLRFTYPRIRAQRDLPIVFLKAPLPTGKPE